MEKLTRASVWQHTSGRQYIVLANANFDGDPRVAAKDADRKYPPSVIYMDEQGKVWSGPRDDWDRRMSPVPPGAQSESIRRLCEEAGAYLTVTQAALFRRSGAK